MELEDDMENKKEEKGTNGEPYIDADIRNMEISVGSQNWDLDQDPSYHSKMTSGEIEVRLPNGTRIDIQAAVEDDWDECTITIFRLNSTEINILEKSSTVTKRAQGKEFTYTQIKKVKE